MENRLISMVEFCFKQNIVNPKEIESLHGTDWRKEFEVRFKRNVNYANFLSQPLQKWMFVPCGEDGEVLEEPRKHFGDNYTPREETHTYFVEYKQAKERCLFDGFEYDYKMECWQIGWRISFDEEYIENKTIEDLIKYNLTLTATALKQIEG